MTSGASELDLMSLIITAALLWPTTTLVIKRLHDIGRSAWSLAGAVGGVLVWSMLVAVALVFGLGEAAIENGGARLFLAEVANTLPVLALVLWLHFAKGQPFDNRYGKVPSGFGFDRVPTRPLRRWIAAFFTTHRPQFDTGTVRPAQ